MINLSIVFPVFNAIGYTQRCLGYLKDNISRIDSKKLKVFVIVVDDGSTDGSADWIRNNHPEVFLCKGDGNLWWSGGINMGVHFALKELRSDYILLWNNDIRPSPGYLIRLSEILDASPAENIILSKIFIDNKAEQILFSLGGNFNSITGKHALIGFGQKADTFVSPPLKINWFPGMGTTIHKSVFHKIGLFDTKYFPHYKGDADFALRASEAGFTLTLYPQLAIWNDRENTGYSNNKTWKIFFRSLVSMKSNTNIYRDILFYHRHGKSILVYRELFRKYAKHIGGFIKWKVMGIAGLKRTNRY